MRKKIYDVKPPRTAQKTENFKKFLRSDKPDSTEKPDKEIRSRREKEKRPIWVNVAAGTGIVLVAVAGFLFFKLPKADVQIWPKVETLSFEQIITADKSVDEVDLVLNVIPAEYFEEEKTDSQQFPATGNASNEGKATGTIRIYNKYDPITPVTLKVGTHFLSDSGKYFITLQRVTIPAGKKSGSKVTPGSVSIKVEAVEGGESYNIGPASFSVPKLSGTAYYYSIFADSSEAMTGGRAGKVKKVIDDDILQAKDSLTKKLSAEISESIKNSISEDYILLSDTISSEVVSGSSDIKVGTTADNFNYEAVVKLKALAFKKSDLEKFAKDYIDSQVPGSKTILASSFKTDYSVEDADINRGKIKLSLNFSSQIYQNIDRNSLASLLVNKNENEIKQTISENMGDQVSNVKIKLWPFWVTKAPNTQKAVKVELKFE